MRAALVAFICLSLVACTTMRAIEPVQPATIQSRVKPGDHVRVVARDGRVYEIDITALEADGLRGRNDRGEGKLRYADIATIERRQVDAIKVIGWVALGYLVTMGLLALAMRDCCDLDSRE